MATMYSGLGGAAGYGETAFSTSTKVAGNNDDGSIQVDITPAFGGSGINFFGNSYTDIYVNSNGLITFDGPETAYSPSGIAGLADPAIAAFWTDHDLNKGGEIYVDVDSTTGKVTVTWDAVAPYSGTGTNSFQIVLTSTGNGDFEIEFVYDNIGFTDGYAGDATAGITDGGSIDYELPGSADPAELVNYPTADFGGGDGAGAFSLNVDGGAPDIPIGRVDGSVGDDVIGLGYSDAEGEVVTTGDDTVFGGDGADTIDADEGSDVIQGDAGNDVIASGSVNDTVTPTTVTNGANLTGTAAQDVYSWTANTGDSATIRFNNSAGSSDGDGGVDYVIVETTNNTGTLTIGDFDMGTDKIVLQEAYTGLTQTTASGITDVTISYANGNDQIFRLYHGSGSFTAADVFTTTPPAGVGTPDDDTLYGGDGADTFAMADDFGNDAIFGGAGNDDVDSIDLSALSAGATVTFSGSEDGTVTDGTYTATFDNIERIVGSANADTINAGADASGIEVAGGGGSDSVTGGSQGDVLYGGTGSDRVDAADGTDLVYGGSGGDQIYAGNGADTALGGSGDDLLYGGAGDDSLSTGTGEDTLFGGAGNDVLQNSTGNDTLFGGGGNDSLIASAGNDLLYGGAGDDALFGGADADTAFGGHGADSIDGGAGDDVITGDSGQSYQVSAFRMGVDYTLSGGTFEGGANDVTLSIVSTGTAVFVDDNAQIGGDSPDETFTDSGQLVVFGSQSYEVLFDDTADFTNDITGDTYTFAILDVDLDGSGTSPEAGEDGTVLIQIGGPAIPDGANLTAVNGTTNGSPSPHDLTGSEVGFADTLSGGGGNDTVFGGAGNDSLAGGTGNDLIYGGDDQDTIAVNDGFGTDAFYGGEGGTDSDTLDLSAMGSGATATFAGSEEGTVTDGADTATFDGIERLVLTGQADAVYSGADLNGLTLEAGGGTDTLWGGSGADLVYGGADADNIFTGSDDDTIFGGGGADDLGGDGGADTLYGGAGSDALSTDAGADTLFGGDDADTFHVNDGFGADTIYGGEGGTDADSLDLGGLGTGVTVTFTGVSSAGEGTIADGTDTAAFHEIETFVLTDHDDAANATNDVAGIDLDAGGGNDSIRGSGANDTIVAGTGNDIVEAGGADDLVYAGIGEDLLYGGGNDDTLYAGAGNDTLDGDSGNDTLFGGAGNDVLDGGNGHETLYGGDGDDRLFANFGSDSFYGGIGIDTYQIDGSAVSGFAFNIDLVTGNDQYGNVYDEIENITGGSAADQLTGDGAANTLQGSAGNDVLSGGGGADRLEGGDDADTFALFGGFGADAIYGGEGGSDTDTLDLSALGTGVTVSLIGDEQGTVTDATDTATFAGIEAVELTGADDLFDASNDTAGITATGSAGNDTFTLGTGNDVIYGGDDRDVVILQDGSFDSDVFYGGEGGLDGDVLDFSQLSGDVDVSFTGDGEGLIWDATSTARFYGFETFRGTDRVDDFDARSDTTGISLDAAGGNDNISGGTGDDVIAVRTSGTADFVFVYADEGDDTVYGGDGYDDLAGEEGDDTLYGGAGNDSLWGGGITAFGEDVIYGGTGADYARGHSGNDTMYGGTGDDNFEGDDGNDLIDLGTGEDEAYGGTGQDTLLGQAGNDSLFGLGGDDIVYGGAGNDRVDGHWGQDTVYGGTGNDSLDGGNDDDTLSGGANDDTLTGGAGNDTLIGDGASVPGDAVIFMRFQDGVSGTATDESGNGHDGTYQGDAVAGGTGWTGQPGDTALVLDGDNDFVEIAHDPAFGLTDGTVSIRFNADDLSNSPVLVSRDAINYGGGGHFEVKASSTGAITVRMQTTTDSIEFSTGTGLIGTGGWHHVAVSFGADGAKIFVDGSEEGSDPHTGGIDGNSEPFVLGGDTRFATAGTADDVRSDLDGMLDEFVLFPRQLSDSEVATLEADGAASIGGGADTLIGGTGNDVMTGGTGNDVFDLSGGGDDTITDFDTTDSGETVVQGATSYTLASDRLDSAALSDVGNALTDQDGTITADEITVTGGGGSDQVLTFPSGETVAVPDGTVDTSTPQTQFASLVAMGVPPCFATGTLILTPAGERPVEDLRVGDMVVTADGGPRPIRWIGVRDVVFGPDNPRGERDKPVMLKTGSLGGGLPRRDLIVSPQHRMVLGGPEVRACIGRDRVFAIAKHLAAMKGVRIMKGRRRVTYHAVLFDRHEVIFAEGAATESFRPGPVALADFRPAHRAEIAAIYPGLDDDAEAALGPPALPFAKRGEVAAILRLRAKMRQQAGHAPAPEGSRVVHLHRRGPD